MAGFHVTGVDVEPQARYCGDAFVQADALTFPLEGYDVIHASPPCINYTIITRTRWRTASDDTRLERVRERLERSGRPYVIENVPGAPLHSPLLLCGTMFGLRVIRHRLFETNYLIFSPPHWPHRGTVLGGQYVTVSGHGAGEHGSTRAWPSAMGISWMKRQELAQAIPPAYTQWIGGQLRRAIEHEQEEEEEQGGG
jgi:DNA (cytosine-5)-methyltransferase 1